MTNQTFFPFNKKSIFIFLSFLAFISFSWSQSLRPPAYPLINVDPYFSIWSFNDNLNEESTVHWTGKENALQGLVRVDGKTYSFLGTSIPKLKTVLPLTKNTEKWKYTMERPEKEWFKSNFKDDEWKDAKGAFSDDGTAPNPWKTEDLWTRREFSLKNTDFDDLMLNLHYDDNVKVYINGILAFEKEGWNDAPQLLKIKEAAKGSLRKGKNVLAIHIKNTAGGSYLDAGLVDKKHSSENLEKAEQMAYSISATQTNYQFLAGGIQLDVTFTAPLLPDDLDLLSRPANYITFSAHSKDNEKHDVQLYFSSAANIAVNTPDQTIEWKRDKTKGLTLLRTGTTTQDTLGRKGDDVRIDWGYLYLGIPDEKETSSRITASSSSVEEFVNSGKLTDKDDPDEPRPANEDPLTLAAALDLKQVGQNAKEQHVILAYDDLYAVEYFDQRLKAWWKRNGQSTKEMLTAAQEQYKNVLEKSKSFDKQLHKEMVEAGGEKYAQITELAYRQSLSAHKLVEDPQGNPLFLSKENFSNGSIGTVDITYPSSPLYLYYNTDLLKGMMIPIIHYSETGLYDHPYAAHDVGTYPIANGQTYGEPMPVEETGNMLVLAGAITKADDDPSFAKEHWKQLTIWAEYLKENGLDPENQLCTDDFAGHLAHNANLSIKAIMGLASYGYIARKLGDKDIAEQYIELARDYAQQWMEMDEDKDGDHYKLTFDKEGTWSQKYNLVWDKLLNLNIFPKEVAEKELRYYLEKQNTYGLPLDSRKTYTKADWILWTATLAKDAKAFDALIEPVYNYINETPSRVPLSDWYETTDAKQVGFQARSVVGGFFIKALDKKWNK